MTSVLFAVRRRLALLLTILSALVVLPGLPAAAAEAYEVHYVPTVGGALIRVEIRRDTKFDAAKQPVILTYSPYNNINGAQPAKDAISDRYLRKGYARAVADVIGTRGSTGCWDYGGPAEQQSGVDVVKFLAGKIPNAGGETLGWSNGNVGMIGVSYEGTTANMVAARGDDVPELKAIVPIAAISRWYGYAFKDGARWFLNSEHPDEQGFDTPLLFDFGFGRTVPGERPADNFAEVVKARAAECGARQHTEEGYSRTPDYDQFWLERDYLKDAHKFRAATLVVHGWQDFNVKQEEGTDLFEALPVDDRTTEAVEGVPFKRLWMTQSTHADGSGPGYQDLLDRFFERTLKGVQNGVEFDTPVATSAGRNETGPMPFRAESSWPPAGTSNLTLHLGRFFDQVPGAPNAPPFSATGEYGSLELTPQDDGPWTHVTTGTISEEVTLNDPANRQFASRPTDDGPIRGHGYYSLFQESAPLTQPLRIAGSAKLDTWVKTTSGGQHITPVLVEVLESGKLHPVQRGFLNLDYRNSLAKSEPFTGWQHGVVEFLPQDYTFSKGSRIGLMLQGSNTMWAVPGNPGAIQYAMGPIKDVTTTGAQLILPTVDLPADPATIFAQ